MERFRNFAVFGFVDGAVSHSWFLVLDHVIKGHQFTDVLARILADNLLYSPIWCAWFISAMAFVEYVFTAKDQRPSRVVVFPVTCVIYTITPASHRVMVAALGSTIYTIMVSLWNASKEESSTIGVLPLVEEPLKASVVSGKENTIHSNTNDYQNFVGFIFGTTTTSTSS